MCGKNLFQCVAGMSLLLGSIGCDTGRTNTTLATEKAEVAETRSFSAVLFPYIPDSGEDNFASLISTLESLFERDNPDIDLVLTIDPNMNMYDIPTLAALLGSGSNAVDMVEVDTILLGDLVAQNLVQPLPFDVTGLGFLSTALAASQVGDTTYAVPTYLCGNYIYCWDEQIAAQNSGQDVINFLSAHPDPTATPLIGNYKGSWTLPSFYVDAWADTHSNDPTQVPASYNLPLDQPTMDIFTPIADLCGTDAGPCLNGDFKDNTHAETLFAQNKANGFVGYTERLFYILQARDGNIALPSVISAPLGTDSKPVMFVDALVLNPNSTGQSATDAEAFSRFMSSVEVRNIIAFSEDVSPKTFPRYLLQALESFYLTSTGSQNLIYQQLYPFVQESFAFPNTGFPEARVELNPVLEDALTSTTLTETKSHVGRVIDGVEILYAPARFPELMKP